MTTTFREHVEKVVEEFLHTVVVVDDRALLDSTTLPAADVPPPARDEGAGTEAPIVHRGVTGDLVDPATVPPTPGRADAPVSDETGPEHELDAKKVTDVFARHGLVCGLLSPQPGEDITTRFLFAARRADLLVLDWVLDRDNGRKATDLIRAVLRADYDHRKSRLRAIAIYTGQTDLREIVDQLRTSLEDLYPDDDTVDDGLAFRKGPVRVAVFAKNDTRLPIDLESRRVPVDDLPRRLRSEFCELVDGIVPTVALAALGALRDDTHRILNVLAPHLDPAFVSHRCALAEPTDADDHVVGLVASEIRSVVEEHEIGTLADHNAVDLWLKGQMANGLEPGKLLEGVGPIPEGVLARIVEFGAAAAMRSAEELQYSRKNIEKIAKSGAQLFSCDSDQARLSEQRFANVMWFRTKYTKPRRTLGLGTVVRSPDSKLLVCLQPLCDSVRLEGETSFLFLELVVTDTDTYQFTIDSPSGATFHAAVKAKMNRIRVVIFAPADGETVITASPVDSGYQFTAADDTTYEWLAVMKQEFAQKVAAEVASELSRVAVDEPEARRNAKHKALQVDGGGTHA